MHHGAALAQGSTEEKDGAPRPSQIDRLRENGETATWHARASGSLLGNRRIRANGQVSRCPRADFYGQQRLSLPSLKPVKKLQSVALLCWILLGQGVRAAAIPAAVLPMLASPCGLPSAGCLPSLGCPARATRPTQKDTQPCGRRFLIFSQVLRLRIEKRVQSSYLSP
jgi:hypothetical protein